MSSTSAVARLRVARSGLLTGPALVIGLVGVAGLAGWLLAGQPGDSTAITPPGCPSSFDRGVADALLAGPVRADRPGLIDGLVPVGPVSVRLCGYGTTSGPSLLLGGPARSGGGAPRSRVLDPTWTAELAALLDAQSVGATSPGWAVDRKRLAACPVGAAPMLLVFRYRQGPPLTVALDGGSCDAAWTPARAEVGRADVRRRVRELLG